MSSGRVGSRQISTTASFLRWIAAVERLISRIVAVIFLPLVFRPPPGRLSDT